VGKVAAYVGTEIREIKGREWFRSLAEQSRAAVGKTLCWAESPTSGIPTLLQVTDDQRSFGAGNETRTRDLNLGKIGTQIA
jgi:hypothetical protein